MKLHLPPERRGMILPGVNGGYSNFRILNDSSSEIVWSSDKPLGAIEDDNDSSTPEINGL